MTKIGIFLSNDAFAEDLSRQIECLAPEITTISETSDSKADLVIVDDKNLKHATSKDTPVILFSHKSDKADDADLTIKMPFKLVDFLEGLKNKTLLPKIRRKECLTFREYNFYPVNKEIISSVTNKIVKLTEKEVSVLKYLYRISPQSAGKEELLENVWEYNTDATTHTIETHIYRLRQKVEQDGGSQLIITENNGYRLNL